MLKNKHAFTLVELIVVAVILAILSTIGLIGFKNYIKTVRDSSRVTQIQSIYDGLLELKIKGKVPRPDDYITITSNSGTLGYQGFAGESILKAMNYNGEGKDPRTTDYFSVYMTKSKNSFQLLTHLEDTNSSLVGYNHNNVFAGIHSNKLPYVFGRSLGILTGTGTDLYTPVQEILTGSLNVDTTTGEYIGYLTSTNSISGTGSKLKILSHAANQAGKFSRDCEDVLRNKPSLLYKDGYYLVDPDGESAMEVYCDMTREGGGWTRVYHSSSDQVARDELDESDWNKGSFTNYSLLWSYKDNQNKNGVYEYLVVNNNNITHRFTQTNKYTDEPVGNDYNMVSGNFTYNGNNGWKGIALGRYGNSSMQSHCALSNGFEGSTWRGCIQDNVSGYGTGPWHNITGGSTWIEIYQK